MMLAPLMDETVTPSAMVTPAPQISRQDVERILKEVGGESALLVLLRDDRVDAATVMEAIERKQEWPSSQVKRWLLAIVDAIVPGP